MNIHTLNIWALLTLVPVAGIVFAGISLTKKGYSSLSRYFTCWIAVAWLLLVFAIVSVLLGL